MHQLSIEQLAPTSVFPMRQSWSWRPYERILVARSLSAQSNKCNLVESSSTWNVLGITSTSTYSLLISFSAASRVFYPLWIGAMREHSWYCEEKEALFDGVGIFLWCKNWRNPLVEESFVCMPSFCMKKKTCKGWGRNDGWGCSIGELFPLFVDQHPTVYLL